MHKFTVQEVHNLYIIKMKKYMSVSILGIHI